MRLLPSALALIAATIVQPAVCLFAADPGSVPERAAWIVDITLASPGILPVGPRRPVRIESSKTGILKRDVIHFSDGSREEFWFARGFVLSLDPGGKSASVFEFRTDRMAENESGASPGFPGLWWTKGKQPFEVIERDGRRLLHFMRESIPVGTPLLHAVTEVWIEEATGRPLEAVTPFASFRYTHQDPPAADLIMPPVFREAAEMAFRRTARREELRNAFDAREKPGGR